LIIIFIDGSSGCGKTLESYPIHTKNDKATEKVLCAIENFTAQSYKIIEEYVRNYKTLNDLV
jgi:hypothetical protein